jgi:hypothetical protein
VPRPGADARAGRAAGDAREQGRARGETRRTRVEEPIVFGVKKETRKGRSTRAGKLSKGSRASAQCVPVGL